MKLERATKKVKRKTKYIQYDYELLHDYQYAECFASGLGSYIINKLGAREDIEDELGIDLVTFVKALKYEIHKIVNGEIEPSSYDVKPMFWKDEWYFIFNEQYGYDLSYHHELVKVKDFGITWTIKEELEND